MENQLIDYNFIINAFLDRWPIDKIKSMTLNQYVDVNNKDTFCQWVENRTKPVGNINSIMGSIKFGIYKRKNKKKILKKYKNDSQYTWLTKYGTNRKEAFSNVKNDIIKIINYSISGKFELIDEIKLPGLFKWKVAYLYSNNRLIFIFNKDVLKKIAKHFNKSIDQNTTRSKLYEIIVHNKPINKTIPEYTNELWNKFKPTKNNSTRPKHFKRKEREASSKAINTSDSTRKGSEPFIITHKHEKIKKALVKELIKEYGKEAVTVEKNFIDIKLELSHKIVFYEVKSSSWASDCVREALGQVLFYLHNYKSNKKKQITVVGNYRPNQDEKQYIDFIKKSILIPFEYEFMNICI